jgi:hypothetical protein
MKQISVSVKQNYIRHVTEVTKWRFINMATSATPSRGYLIRTTLRRMKYYRKLRYKRVYCMNCYKGSHNTGLKIIQ